MTPERDRAEFAVIVADPWQGKGLGQKLIERVIEIARENGVKLFIGEVLAANQPMLDLVKKLGFNLLRPEEGTCRVELDARSREHQAFGKSFEGPGGLGRVKSRSGRDPTLVLPTRTVDQIARPARVEGRNKTCANPNLEGN